MDRNELREIYRIGGAKAQKASSKSGLFFKQSVLSILIIIGAFGVKAIGKSTDSVAAMAQTVEGELSSTRGFSDLENYLDEKISSLPVFAAKEQKEKQESAAPKEEQSLPTATIHTEMPEEDSGISVHSEEQVGGMTFLRAENKGGLTEKTYENYCDVFYATEPISDTLPIAEPIAVKVETKPEPAPEKKKTEAPVDPFAGLAVPAWGDLSKHQLPVKLVAPISGTVTSGFGYREHPTTHKITFHPGVDIAANKGTPIAAAFSGKVEETGEDPAYGKYVVLRYNKALSVFYAHMDTVEVKVGKKVKAGGRIGTVGSTGISTGSHLHFEVRLNGIKLNALYYIKV